MAHSSSATPELDPDIDADHDPTAEDTQADIDTEQTYHPASTVLPPEDSAVFTSSGLSATASASGKTSSHYDEQVAQRNSHFKPSHPTSPVSYNITHLISLPHSVPANALALPPCFSHIFTGGPDGFIRRYAFHSSLAATIGRPYESNPREREVNLMMKQGGHAAGHVSGVMIGYWENGEPEKLENLDLQTRLQKARFAPRSVGSMPDGASPVHSLAVESNELWGLSGTDSGTINLFTIRHDEGQIRHTFASSSTAHANNRPVSCLALFDDEKSFLSGSWDSRIVQWDLNTGQAVRTYDGHKSQISSISWRPSKQIVSTSSPEPNDDATEGENGSASASVGVQNDGHLTAPSSRPTSSAGRKQGKSPDPSHVSYDPLFDGGPLSSSDSSSESESNSPKSKTASNVAASLLPSSSAKQSKSKQRPTYPVSQESDNDVFMSTSIDGAAYIWDRRVRSDSSGGICKLDMDVSDTREGRGRNWCSSGIFSATGTRAFLGRRNATIDVYDLRKPAFTVDIFKLPLSCGPVSSLTALSDDKHILSATQDNIRLWDVDAEKENKIPYRVIPGPTGVISRMIVDPTESYLVVASGGRGWLEGRSTDTVNTLELKKT